MEQHFTSVSQVIYGLDDKPPFGRAFVLALQHVLTMFGATVAVPLLFGPVLWPVDPDASEAVRLAQQQQQQVSTAILISSVMLCSGLATLIQATVGTRLPIVQGVSFSFLTAFFFIIGKVTSPVDRGGFGGDGALAMQYIAGAIMVGALIEMVIGFSGLMGWLRKLLSPVVVGPVIMLIGLALFQHGAPKAGTDWTISGLTIFLVIVFSLLLARNNRFFKLFPILTAIICVVTLCWILSLLGVYKTGDPSFVDLTAAENSDWVRGTPNEVVFPWGYPKFELAFVLAVLAGYLASMIESFGDYHACSNMAGGGDPTPKQISRGIGCEGFGCFLTSIFGGFSSTSYSENIGLVGLTKVGSRYVVQIGAVLLILLGFFGKFGAMAAAIPGPVVGGLYCALFGLIAAVGVQQLAKCDLSSDRNLFIAGFSLFMGLSVPAYFAAVADTSGMLPGQSLAVYRPTAEPILASLWEGLSGIVRSIGSTGMAVAAIIGLLLDNVIPGTEAERGMQGSGMLVTEAGNVGEGVDS